MSNKFRICCLLIFLGCTGKPVMADTIQIDLTKALEIALNDNPTLKIAQKEIQRADYSKKDAYLKLFPVVQGSASYSRAIDKQVMFLSGDFTFPGVAPGKPIRMGYDNSWSATVSAGVPLFNYSIYQNIDLSEADIELALESARSSRIGLISEVKKAFYTVLLAEESYNVLKKSYANAMNSLGSIKKQYERGLVAEYDFIRADVQARNVKPSVLQAENNLLMSYLTLKILLGIPGDQNIKADGNLDQFSNDYQKFRPSSLDLGNNSDLKQADLRMKKLSKQLSMTKLQRLPSLNLIGNYTFIAQNDNFNMFHYYWVPTSSVGLQMSIPILNGSTNRFKEKQIELGIEQMQLQKQYLNRNLNAQATNAITTMRQAYEQIESNAVGVKQAEKGYNIAQIRYNTGSGTLLELNDAEVALTQSKLNYNSAIYSYLKAKIDYEKTLGQE